jgi:heme exporter protein C
MKYWWWKVLSLVLLLGVVIVGLRTPLSPALIACTPDRMAAGELVVTVTGYNTHFTAGAVSAWIENNGQRVCGNAPRAISDTRLEVRFTVPAGLRNEFSDLWVRTPAQGDLIYRDAFYTTDRGEGLDAAVAASCQPAEGAAASDRFSFPNRNILNESVRNLFFHVPMWFAMVALMSIGAWKSVRVLRVGEARCDRDALAAVQVGLLFGVFGLITGSLWARVTWGTWWTPDAKLNGAAVAVLMYLAYLVLRGSVPEPAKRARLAAIYSIFAYVFMLLFFFVLPRLNAVDSLHPGNGGNPAFNTYDLDSQLRLIFYPACIGWIGLSIWMYDLRRRMAHLHNSQQHANDR